MHYTMLIQNKAYFTKLLTSDIGKLVSHAVRNLFTMFQLLLKIMAPLLSSISLDRLYVIVLSLSLSLY